MSNVRVRSAVVTWAEYESRTSCYMIKNKKKGREISKEL